MPETERTLHEQHASPVNDPAKRRELKIKQYKQEKELKARIEVSTDKNETRGSQTHYLARLFGNAEVLLPPYLNQPPTLITLHLFSLRYLQISRTTITTTKRIQTRTISFAKQLFSYYAFYTPKARLKWPVYSKNSSCSGALRHLRPKHLRTTQGRLNHATTTICGDWTPPYNEEVQMERGHY